MVPELQLGWMRFQVILIRQVRLVEFADIVIDKGDWNNERNQFHPVSIDDLDQFRFLV
jgi:hypothetical protein